MPAKYVRPYSKGQKNDFCDAEAVQRPIIKFVTTKTAKQLNLQALHGRESQPQESEQDDKWSFCLTAGTLCPANQERQ